MAVQQRDRFVLAATGDAILTRELTPYLGVSDRFDRIVGHLRAGDATATNLEVLAHDYEGYPAATSGGTYMRAPPEVVDELTDVGCNLFSAATNHTFDYSHGGIERTIDALEERNVAFAGLGRTLYEARRPAYVETPAGRVAMVSACTSITPGSEAGARSQAMGGRPGLNPLAVERIHRVTGEQVSKLRDVSEAAGMEAIKRSWLERGLYYGHDWNDGRYFHFGDMKFERVEDDGETGVAYRIDEEDRAAVLEWVAEARQNADWVVVSIHSHQGVDGLQTTTGTPEFLRTFAHDSIEAGADAFVGHGPHVLRGVEVYRNRPIFYSLGNFIVQNETVERLPPESYRRYGHEDYTKVSRVFNSRLYDEDGDPKGDLSNEEFWWTVVPTCTFTPDGGLEEVTLHPCTLQREQERPQRGIPVAAVDDEAATILDNVAERSSTFDTEVERRGDDGVVVLD